MPDAKVLVVDDEPDIRELCRVYLDLQGYQVVEAADGREAVEAAVREQPDLVLLDVMMPVVDGWAALEELRTNERTRDIPVIMLTAKASEADQIRGWSAGVVDYVPKPFHPNALGELVEQALLPFDDAERAARRQRHLEQLELVRELRDRRI